MEAILLQYGWVLIVLVVLEGLLATDNAVVMAVMVKHLPQERKKALFYGLFGALIFRFSALFVITVLVNYWQIQAVGANFIYYLCLRKIYMIYENIKMKKQRTENGGKRVLVFG